ncbi:hypothetical protein LARI1_G004896 [Lachnellula arida]|uniref:C2H2-type domain-containing protein n=1 Tax=Lachnellula arida TaxID=1316785 RepID=A0A8T9BDV3_9HELO|nr:hypothetical protein LARI1_G004896 [Lachnellula arida]
MKNLHTETRWSKSFPTVVSSPFSARHQKNHIRAVKCDQCKKAFAFQKDLERHKNTVHHLTVKYFCTHGWCRDSIKPSLDDCILWGFRRKDHWQKHMRDEHSTNRGAVRAIQKDGIPMAVLKNEAWVAVLPRSVKADIQLPSSRTLDTEVATHEGSFVQLNKESKP